MTTISSNENKCNRSNCSTEGNIILMLLFPFLFLYRPVIINVVLVDNGCPPGISSGPQRVPQIINKMFLKIVNFNVQQIM